MKWTGLNDLRESYLNFFESKGHLRMNSFPLVPQGDNSILLINAGMTPLKKYFQGVKTPPRNRITTCQKCIRTIDIENVGKTSRHGSYFEMLGNFSFGDYFKREAITWAWEFFTKVLEIPEERLWVSVYKEDDEAKDIWINEVGVPTERVVKMGKEDNFWEHGSGPCGPCSEIYFDRQTDEPATGIFEGYDGDRYVEVWNLVFTQFDNDGRGNYTPLANKNIDTGMGLERLACAMQGVDNLFEVDTVRNIMGKISELTGVEYKADEQRDISLRVITDHIRSTVFLVGDGVRPTNEGRGYVLRRLLRRAARHGRLLGVKEPFLYKICDTVIDENLSAYAELDEKREYIKKVIKTEEESFSSTVDKGILILDEYINELKENNKAILSGEKVFKLHDTYGFPFDLTREILEEKGFSVDEEKFKALMKEQKEKARANQSFKGGWSDSTADAVAKLSTEFTGYTSLSEKTELLAILKDGELVKAVEQGDSVAVIIKTTPFYAESGGQIGDKGTISIGDNVISVTDTKKMAGGQYICYGIVESGAFSVGDEALAQVDQEKRQAIMRNHTTAHILQAALRSVLGEHVLQAGQLVDEHRCRFDFSHFNAMSDEEIAEVESICNREILAAKPVVIDEMAIDKAREKGAMALFGEKYGDIVRVVEIEGFSTELCGGTHVDNTSKIGLMKIISESSVSAGTRRIEAVTGANLLFEYENMKRTIIKTSKVLKSSNINELVKRAEAVMDELSDKQKKINSLETQIANTKLSDLKPNAQVNGVSVITAFIDGADANELRTLGDSLKDKYEDLVVVLAGFNGEKGNLLVTSTKSAISKGANSGTIVREVSAIAGGRGGGKPDSAMAGYFDKAKISEALDKAVEIISKYIK